LEEAFSPFTFSSIQPSRFPRSKSSVIIRPFPVMLNFCRIDFLNTPCRCPLGELFYIYRQDSPLQSRLAALEAVSPRGILNNAKNRAQMSFEEFLMHIRI
jgi:hypothetical protein